MDSLYEDWGVAFWPSFWLLQPCSTIAQSRGGEKGSWPGWLA